MAQSNEIVSTKVKWILIIFGLINSVIGSYHFWYAIKTPGWELLQFIIVIVAGPLAFLFGVLVSSKMN